MSLSAGQLRAIEYTERASSILSLLSSSFVITTFLWSRHFHTPINRLIFYASWGNTFASAATVISISGISHGVDSPLCQFQGFFMQWFIVADALWAFCMACNVYLTLFRRYNISQLRKLEWKYCIVCYGLPFIPAFVYLFIETKARGKIYGSAIWCWVRSEWGFLRIAVVFAPAWALIVLSAAIYIFAGRKILRSRRQLRSLAKDSLVSSSMTQNQIDFPRATDVAIANEAHPALVKGASSSSPHCDLELGRTSNPMPKYPSDPVHTDSRTAMSSSILPLGRPQSAAKAAAKKRRTSLEANTIIWTYSKFAMLFLLALLVTWIPPTTSRVYNFVHSSPNFTLSYLSGLVVPLQGFWNSIIYVATSYPAVKSIFDISLLRRQRAISIVSRSDSRNNGHPRSVL